MKTITKLTSPSLIRKPLLRTKPLHPNSVRLVLHYKNSVTLVGANP